MTSSAIDISGLYESRRSFLCFYAMGFLDSYQEAEDVVQSVFEKLLLKDINLKDPMSLNSYLMSSVRNGCLNHLSRKKIHGRYASSILSENQDIDDKSFLNSRIEAEVLWEIFSKVNELPSGCRQVFKMSYLENLSNQEIADRLGISVNTVKSQKARSKELLRESLKDLFAVAAVILGL